MRKEIDVFGIIDRLNQHRIRTIVKHHHHHPEQYFTTIIIVIVISHCQRPKSPRPCCSQY